MPQPSFVRALPLTRRALAFACERHAGQRRESDGAPFMFHPLEAASLLDRCHYRDHVVAAAVLHDVLEDTATERAELESRFGPEVSELVALVSDDSGIDDFAERKDDVGARVREAGGHALAVYAADKVSKARELRTLELTGLSAEEIERKLRHYGSCLTMLEEAIPGSRLVELLRFELEGLEQFPPLTDR